MTAKTIPFTEKVYQQRLREGRGRGIGADYIPWILRSELLSDGTRNLANCGRFNREAHLFSVTEHKGFLFYDHLAWPTAVYEQYPLELEETQEIARSLGIKHPMDTDTRLDIVVTTDLVIEAKNADGAPFRIARSCKPTCDISNFNHIEHAEIERRYWKKRNVEWQFFIDSTDLFPHDVYANLELMKPHRFKHLELEAYDGCLEENCRLVLDAVNRTRRSEPLIDIAKAVQGNLNGGYDARQLMLYLIYCGRLAANVFAGPYLQQDALAAAEATRVLVPPTRRFA